MTGILEDFAIFVLIVIAIPFMVLMALIDGVVALLNWCASTAVRGATGETASDVLR